MRLVLRALGSIVISLHRAHGLLPRARASRIALSSGAARRYATGRAAGMSTHRDGVATELSMRSAVAMTHLCDRCEAEATVTYYMDGRPIGRRCDRCADKLEKKIADGGDRLSRLIGDNTNYPGWGPKRGQA